MSREQQAVDLLQRVMMTFAKYETDHVLKATVALHEGNYNAASDSLAKAKTNKAMADEIDLFLNLGGK